MGCINLYFLLIIFFGSSTAASTEDYTLHKINQLRPFNKPLLLGKPDFDQDTYQFHFKFQVPGSVRSGSNETKGLAAVDALMASNISALYDNSWTHAEFEFTMPNSTLVVIKTTLHQQFVGSPEDFLLFIINKLRVARRTGASALQPLQRGKKTWQKVMDRQWFNYIPGGNNSFLIINGLYCGPGYQGETVHWNPEQHRTQEEQLKIEMVKRLILSFINEGSHDYQWMYLKSMTHVEFTVDHDAGSRNYGMVVTYSKEPITGQTGTEYILEHYNTLRKKTDLVSGKSPVVVLTKSFTYDTTNSKELNHMPEAKIFIQLGSSHSAFGVAREEAWTHLEITYNINMYQQLELTLKFTRDITKPEKYLLDEINILRKLKGLNSLTFDAYGYGTALARFQYTTSAPSEIQFDLGTPLEIVAVARWLNKATGYLPSTGFALFATEETPEYQAIVNKTATKVGLTFVNYGQVSLYVAFLK